MVMPKNPTAIRIEADRRARAAAALRANLSRRKDQQRQQSVDEPAPAGPLPAKPGVTNG